MPRTGSNPNAALVYGADHSPWVQAVLLGLHERGIPTRLTQTPPLAIAFDTGIFMPAVRYDDAGPWHYDSATILSALGFEPIEAVDLGAMQTLFLRNAWVRVDSPLDFFASWSRLREDAPNPVVRAWRHFTRTLAPFYFFVLISVGRRRSTRPSRAKLVAGFAHFERQLAGGAPFLAGETPGVADLQLFGQIQMLGSIPGEPLDVVQSDPALPNLRAWISRLHARWIDYPHLHSGPFFEPRAGAPRECGPIGRACFWAGLGVLVLALPLSLAATFYFVGRVGRKGFRAGPRSAAQQE